MTTLPKHRRGDDVLQADTSSCSQMWGAPRSGAQLPLRERQGGGVANVYVKREFTIICQAELGTDE